jgi:hypothetical protein
MPHCGSAWGVFSILIVSAGRFTERPVGSGRPVRGAVGYWGSVVVVVDVVVVVGVVVRALKKTRPPIAARTTTITTAGRALRITPN